MAQNPARGDRPFFLRTVQDESGAKCLLFKPPDTELLFIHVAAINHLVIASRVAPKFIREVKSILAMACSPQLRFHESRLIVSAHGTPTRLSQPAVPH